MLPRPIVKTQKPIPPGLQRVLEQVLSAASLNECYVSSIARSPREQAVAMFANCKRTGPAAQYRTYLDAGDRVIDVFNEVWEENPQGLDRPDVREQVIKAMTDKILEIGPEKVSHHCLGPDSPLWVCDVTQASIAAEGRFLKAVRQHPQYSKDLVENNVYHLEFKQQPAVQTT